MSFMYYDPPMTLQEKLQGYRFDPHVSLIAVVCDECGATYNSTVAKSEIHAYRIARDRFGWTARDFDDDDSWQHFCDPDCAREAWLEWKRSGGY
jgi:hypothetical protein